MNTQLLDQIVDYLRTAKGAEEIYTEDVLGDFNVPGWQYFTRGRDELHSVRAGHSGLWEVELGRVRSTSDGLLAELRYAYPEHGQVFSYRAALLLILAADGRVGEQVLYCTGPWDEATRRRHALEADS